MYIARSGLVDAEIINQIYSEGWVDWLREVIFCVIGSSIPLGLGTQAARV